MKIALLHDYLVQYGGAERVLEKLLEIFPEAPIYTLLYQPKRLAPTLIKKLKGRKIITSALQKIPGAKNHHQLFPIFMPYFIEQFDFSDFDIVFSDTTGFSKGIITRPKTLHISYCHTPLRYAWDDSQRYINEYGYPWPLKILVPFGIHYLRIWDRQAAQRVDYFLTNSHFVRKRIAKYYQREAKIIYPPIETKKFKIAQIPKNYFLVVQRLLPYKKIDLVIEAFNQLNLPLLIVGRGPQEKKLKKMAGKKIRFLGNVYGKSLQELYRHCRAFIFPQEEDFGIAPVEVIASGRPVIAYKSGGALETIKEGINGIFFKKQSVVSLKKAVEKFLKMRFDSKEIRKSALKFDEENFKKEIKNFTKDKWREFQKIYGA